MKDLYNIVDKYKEKKEELELIKKYIEKRYKEFDDSMQPSKNYLNKKSEALSSYNNINSVYITLGELLNRIAFMVGVNKEDLNYTINTNLSIIDGLITKQELIDDHEKILILISISTKDQRFKYNFEYKSDLLDIQSNGETLIDHCSFKKTKSNQYGNVVRLCINKDVDDIIVQFDLETLSSEKENQDIINNILNVKYKQKQKNLGGKK